MQPPRSLIGNGPVFEDTLVEPVVPSSLIAQNPSGDTVAGLARQLDLEFWEIQRAVGALMSEGALGKDDEGNVIFRPEAASMTRGATGGPDRLVDGAASASRKGKA